MMKPRRVTLEGDYDNIEEYEDYLGMDLTEEDLSDPALIGQWATIAKYGAKAAAAGIGALGALHRKREAQRVAQAKNRILAQRQKRKMQVIAKMRAMQTYVQKKENRKKLLLLGIPVIALIAFMAMRR